MSTAIRKAAIPPIPADIQTKKWTRAEYQMLREKRLLEDQVYELVDGNLLIKTGSASALYCMNACLEHLFGPGLINQRCPIDVAFADNPRNEPKPDGIVMKRNPRGKPKPEDLYLVIEIADAFLDFYLTTKATLYARAGIIEYWVLDLGGRRLIRHHNPDSSRYADVVEYSENESIAPLAAPDARLRVGDVFPG